jgi:hypothetical protein
VKVRALILLATVSALLAASAPAGAVVPADLALRLTDLDPGYVVDDETCEPTTFYDDGPSDFLKQVGDLHHVGCRISFHRVWKTPGTPPSPLGVSSYVFEFDSADGPQAALTRPRDAVAFLSGSVPEVVQPAPAVGDEAVLLHGKMPFPVRHPWWSTIVLWRSGNVLAAVQTTSRSDAGLQAALRLAAVQQARIASPTPLSPDDNDDAEVGLDAPDLRLPIYWLGHDLAARGRLPGLSLHLSESLTSRRTEAVYMAYGRGDEIVVTLMRPSVLRRPVFRHGFRRLARDPCTRRERVALASGHATIWSRHGGRCHAKADATFAIARLSGVVVLLGLDAEQPVTPSVARYATRTGMLRLMRALHRREPRPLPAPAP